MKNDKNRKINRNLFQAHFLSIVFCFWFSMFIYVQTFGVYLAFLDFGYYATGIIMGSYGIMQIILRFPIGFLADRYQISGKFLVGIGFIASLASVLLLALSTEFLPIFMGRFLAGFTAAMWVVLTIWYSSSFSKQQSLKAMSQLQYTMVGSQLISMVLSGLIADFYGFTYLFWVGAVFASLGFILVLLLPNQEPKRAQESIQMKHAPIFDRIIRIRKIWSLSILSLIGHAVLFTTIFGFSSVYFTQLNEHQSAIMFLVVSFMLPHGMAPLILSIKKSQLKNSFKLLMLCFVVGISTLLFLGSIDSWVMYCILHGILGLSLGFVFPILLDEVYKADEVGASKTIMGLYQSVYSIGIVAGPIVAGYFALKVEIGAVFILSAFLLLLGGILSLVESVKLSKGKGEIGEKVKSI
ncbi:MULTISPECIES: MFS transporter [Metabacillus]|uniref:MFS transporter n=1 Tax=Metabacillus endolithicus TaxID=1535204 RepID=A0ABW5C4A7_9BACI|nr:MFS transporter [Metabacillus endolithicus]UPG61965.1 MFS transporter [Metabacillus endolithicus]